MGDGSVSTQMLSEEQYRVSTYEDNSSIVDKVGFAKAGFYFTHIGHIVKCFNCQLEVDSSEISSLQGVHSLHREKSPQCSFAEATLQQPLIRTKKFISYDGLRFEKERLETFIDWPVTWLDPEALAKDGFYYLRTADHCACVFCRGIVGAWEEGDTPRNEHMRHFPHCPFIKGQPVGNIPLAHSQIISRLTPSPESAPPLLGMDVCGTGRPLLNACTENKLPNKANMSLVELGLPQHVGPKRKDFLTKESRLSSFMRWPEQVKQTPQQLAEAGFFYCGLSDHVRCYHCGNGLRNWEAEDDPWEEHARWYPECNFVLVKKGQEFIDKVRREKPPYLPSQSPNKNTNNNNSLARPTITEAELNPLMDLDIIKATLAMGFPTDKVRAALRRKLEQTGMPFFGLEPCIEAVLQYMEEETRLALRQNTTLEVESEATAQQDAKIGLLRGRGPRRAATVSSDVAASTTTTNVSTTASAATSASASSSTPSTSTPSLPSSSGPTSTLPAPAAPADDEPMETDESPVSPPGDIISEANEVIVMAERALQSSPSISSPSTSSSVPSSSSLATSTSASPSPSICSPNTLKDKAVKQITAISKKSITAGKPQSSQDLAEELERIKDSRTCKVCMDAEMDIVFLPCSHMVTCSSCALALTECPICRQPIKLAIKPILS